MKGRNEICGKCKEKRKYCACRPTSGRWLQRIVVLVLIGAMSVLAYILPAKISKSFQAWPLLAFQEKHVEVKKPYLPQMTPIEAPSVGPLDQTSPKLQGLRVRLGQLITAHPKERVREHLGEAIFKDEVFVFFDSSLGPLAAFVAVPKSYIAKEDWRPGKGSYELLQVKPSVLASLGTQDEILGAMVIVGHEGIHYEQWERAPVGSRARRAFLTVTKETAFDDERCTLIWTNEREAHKEGCLWALEWGIPDLVVKPGFCRRATDEVAFDQIMFLFMTEGRGVAKAPACHPLWAKLAGHPHPWAFKIEAWKNERKMVRANK